MPRSILKGPSPLLVSRQVASTSGVGRAHGPPPPSVPLAAPEPQPGPAGRGHAPHPSPVLSSATRAFQDTPWGRDQGDRDAPFSWNRRGGADPRQGRQPRWVRRGVWDAAGSAVGWLGAAESGGLGPGLLGDRPGAARKGRETGPSVVAAASLRSESRGPKEFGATLSPS